jgi:Mn2+/Fe2+ NRAMP family transporter
MAHDEVGPPEERGEVLGDIVETAAHAAGASGTPGTAAPHRGTALWRLLFSKGARQRSIWIILAGLGPGLVAANAGNDAGGIATYASVGARFGYSVLWMFPLILISLAVVQEMAARMGAATGKGLSDLIRENFPIHATSLVLLALLVANGGTVISEYIGIVLSVDLIFPPWVKYIGVPLLALAIWLMVVKGSYASVEKVFLAMTLVFFAYPVSAVLAHPDWAQAARQTVYPTLAFSNGYLTQAGYLVMVVTTIGTTITPYMQVYVQSSVADKGITPRDYNPERIEVYAGSVFANLIAVFIVLATAATLFAHGERNIGTAADAAVALRPLAGPYAEYLFAVGLFGASMLAAAVLPLATAYSITEALGVEKGVNASFREAPVFMGLFTGLMALGVLVALVIPPQKGIQALIFVQDIDCLMLPFILFAILRLVNDRRLMGDMVNGRVYNAIARITAVVVTGLSLVYVVNAVLGQFGVNL